MKRDGFGQVKLDNSIDILKLLNPTITRVKVLRQD